MYFWVKKLAFFLNIIGGISLIGIVVVVLVDIVTRTIFGLTDGQIDITIVGSFELVRYGLLIAIAYSMPYGLSRGQVVVDLFTGSWSEKVKGKLLAFYMLFFGAFGLVMVYGLVQSAADAIVSGETTQDLIIPMQYIYYTAAIGMLVLGLRGLTVSYVLWFEQDGEKV